MLFKSIIPDKSVSLLVKSIQIYEDEENTGKTILPFYADGFPGLMFHETEIELWVSPNNKKMPSLFLYGQTIKPIELIITGSYKLIVFQLYPFVLKALFNVDPQSLNDDCYNLSSLKNNMSFETAIQLQHNKNPDKRISIITDMLKVLFADKKKELDLQVAQAIRHIIHSKEKILIRDLYNKFHLTERTFERRFYNSVGITAKQFYKIIRFQQSLEQINKNDYDRLTDIVYTNGFADQSHFIKVFKAFTGKTPLAFKLHK